MKNVMNALSEALETPKARLFVALYFVSVTVLMPFLAVFADFAWLSALCLVVGGVYAYTSVAAVRNVLYDLDELNDLG